MANEFKHKTVGTQMTQSEYEAVGGHVLDSQAAGDLVYASSTTQLSRLGIGTAGKVLMTNSGASAPEWSAAITGVTSIHATDLIIGEDSQTAIDFGTANEIDFKVDNAARLTLTTGALYPVTNNQIDLGTSSLEFKDAYFDGTVTSDAFAGPLTGDVTGNADTATALATGRTIGMTGDVVWTSASFTGAGNVTGSATIQADAVESGMLNDNIISGQTEITTGLAAADELLYSDAGTVKRIGLDTLATKLFSVASAGTVAQANDHMLFLDNGATGDVIVESIDDFLSAIAGSNISVSSSQLVASDTNTTYTAGTLLDLSSTTFNVDLSEAAAATMAAADEFIILDNDDSSVAKRESLQDVLDTVAGTVATTGLDRSGATLVVSDLHPVGVSGSANQLLTDDGDGTVTSESNLTFDGTDLNIATGSIEVRTIDYSDGDNAITIADGGGVTFAQDIEITDGKVINLDSTQTDNNFSGITAEFANATGSTISKGKIVYLTGTATQVALARANADNTMPGFALAIADVANGASGKFLLHGIVHDSDILDCTIGGEMYVSEDTAGAMTKTLPASSGDRVQVVGLGLHADKMLFNPSFDIVERG